MQSKIAISMLVVILAIINFSIYSKEQHLKLDSSIYLQLVPVDPRSLMQGDYMALRFVVANKLSHALLKKADPQSIKNKLTTHNGKVVVKLDKKRIATFLRIYQGEALQANELILNYRVRNNKIKFASNAFFFEEGTAEAYAQARYGEFKVDPQGGLLLKAMFTRQLKLIQPE